MTWGKLLFVFHEELELKQNVSKEFFEHYGNEQINGIAFIWLGEFDDSFPFNEFKNSFLGKRTLTKLKAIL